MEQAQVTLRALEDGEEHEDTWELKWARSGCYVRAV